jgi:hypothetical protein
VNMDQTRAGIVIASSRLNPFESFALMSGPIKRGKSNWAYLLITGPPGGKRK